MLRDGDEDGAAAVALGIEQGAHATERTPMGEVVLAGAGPGDPDLVTLGTRAVLADADVVFHDALVGPEVLRLCASRTRLHRRRQAFGKPTRSAGGYQRGDDRRSQGGRPGRAAEGGDPFLFGRGGEEVEALRRAGVPVRLIPGVSAALAAPAAAGIPVTHRGVAASVAFVTGHRAGGENTALAELARSVDTLVVLMPAELDSLARRLSAALGADRPAAIVSKATTPEQQVIRAPIGGIAAAARAANVLPPSTLVVGDVVDVGAEIGTLGFASSRAIAGAFAASR